MSLTNFFTIDVYDTPNGTLQGIAHLVSDLSLDWKVDAAGQVQLSCLLTDPATAPFKKNYYVTISLGINTPTAWWSGYIQTVDRSAARSNEYRLTLADPLSILRRRNVGGALVMGPPQYTTVIDLLNGNPSGSTTPGQMGVLPPGFRAQWRLQNGTIDNTQAPLIGGVIRTDWTDSGADIKAIAQDWGFHFRVVPNTYNPVLIDCGYFGDASGLTAWGGDPLALALGQPTGSKPNGANAQEAGYSQIDGPGYSDDLSHVVNCVWPIGHGPAGSFVSLRPLFGNDYSHTAVYGGKTFYTGPSYSVTVLGITQTYQIVAALDQDSNTSTHERYKYGLLNVTSASQYDLCEAEFTDHSIMDANALLQATLGRVAQFADPIASWVLPVKHPRIDSNRTDRIATGNYVMPGQKIDVQYAGKVQAITMDNTAGSATYGQWIPTGSTYQYLAFPSSSDSTYQMASRCMRVQLQWTGHAFSAVYTMGRGHTRPAHYFEQIWAHLKKTLHKPAQHQSFTTKDFRGIPWFMHLANDDRLGQQLTIQPSGWAYTDTPDATFFPNHHGVSFDFTFQDQSQIIDLAFMKPVDGTLPDYAASATYGNLRLAGPTSGSACGFGKIDTSGTLTSEGRLHQCGALDSNGRVKVVGTYRIQLEWADGQYEAILWWDPGDGDGFKLHGTLATWNDATSGGSRVLQQLGAIGILVTNGTDSVTISDFHAHKYYHRPVRLADHLPHHPSAHQWKNLRFVVTAWDGTNATVLPQVLHNPAYLVNSHLQLLHNADTSDIVWGPGSIPAITGVTQGTSGKPWIVYNGESYAISDGTNTVASKSFGALQLTKYGRHSWDFVFVVGALSDTVDRHTHKPWVDGWHIGAHAGHGYQSAKQSSGRGHHNPHHPHKKKRRVTSTPTGGGGGGASIAKAE